MATASPTAEGASGFGKNYCVLNLDLMTILIEAVKDTTEGQKLVSSCSRWNDAVHKKYPRPLTIFTSLFFDPTEPELEKDAPFTKLIEGFGPFAAGSPGVQIASDFTVDEKDVILQKIRWYVGAGNNLEQILKAQNIDTVIISGLSLSGVVMSTVYRLFDLDYSIYVISDNVLDLPLDHDAEVSKVMLGTLLPKMNLRLVSVDEALHMLEQS
ncbi:hypothetical protein GTA08_BOTSDO13253 [Neofusicoccum parvum]|uniref:Uncharacterized protein n=1 Tax=Neofusicoccum parvum TaxID=310453 RepID=A0ACB5RSJ7_9PEZI|nr:hypothetical protein GTA08_BOTSDO13253 [Neofusicoccum parvum]